MRRAGEGISKRLMVIRNRHCVLLSGLIILMASIVANFPILSLAMNESPHDAYTWNVQGASRRSDGSSGSGAVSFGQPPIPSVVSSSKRNSVAEWSTMATESKISTSSLPYLVIHMGPDKTGTTSIQSFLTKNQNFLAEDGYDVSYSKGSYDQASRKLAASLLNCFIFSNYKSQPCHKTRNMEKPLAAFRDKGTYPNILWSTEGFRWANFRGNPDWPWFLQQIQPHRTIRIIVVYRRYFDWITSRYQEEHRSSEYSGTAFSGWPDDFDKKKQGLTIPTFGEYYQRESSGLCPQPKAQAAKNECTNFFANRLKNNTEGKVEVAHPLLQMVQPLLESNLTVSVINLHGENDLLEAFFCESLPWTVDTAKKNTSRACEQAHIAASIQMEKEQQQRADHQIVPQPSKRKKKRMMWTIRRSDFLSIQYDMIGLEAHRLQILPWNIPRHTAKEYIQWYHEEYKKEKDDLPWSCPTKKTLQSLEETSYRFEQELLQLDIGRTLVFTERHSDAFARAVQQNKFCSVNVTKVFEDEGFLAYLRNSTFVPKDKETKNHRGRKRQRANP